MKLKGCPALPGLPNREWSRLDPETVLGGTGLNRSVSLRTVPEDTWLIPLRSDYMPIQKAHPV